jgi:probable phosphoglycerate mutase
VELVIVRHARPEHIEAPDGTDGAGGIGPADPGLTAIGRRQAERLAAHLAPLGVDHIVTSPLTRARQTAEPLARAVGLEPEVVDGVAEYDRDDASYVPAEVTRAMVKRGEIEAGSFRDPLTVLGEVERDRWIGGVADAFRTIAATHPGERVAVVCHGMVTSVWFARMLGIDDTMRFVPDYCGVSRVLASGSTDIVTVRSFNETHFLGDTHIPLF